MDSAVAANKKAATVGFMIAGILIGIGAKVLLDSIGAIATGTVGRFVTMDLVRHGFPVLAGLGSFIALQANAAVRVWGDEVVSELKKIVWPSREHTVRMTLFVCIMLVLSGAALGLLDVVSGKLIQWLLSKNLFGLLS